MITVGPEICGGHRHEMEYGNGERTYGSNQGDACDWAWILDRFCYVVVVSYSLGSYSLGENVR